MRKLALVGAGLVALVDVIYLATIEGQRSDQMAASLRVPFVVGFIGVMALSAALASWRRLERRAPLLLSWSAAGLVSLGLLAMFSIGIAILIGAVPVVVAGAFALRRAHQPGGWLQAVGGLVLALAVLAAGIQLTELPVGCPPTGYMEGSGSGLFSGPYHWQCVNGTLTVAAGECTHGGATVDSNGRVSAAAGC